MKGGKYGYARVVHKLTWTSTEAKLEHYPLEKDMIEAIFNHQFLSHEYSIPFRFEGFA